MWYTAAKKSVEDDRTAFLAFWLPADARRAFDHIDDLDEDLHMTVLYLEGIREEDREPLLQAVEAVCNVTAPISCQTTEIGVMGNESGALVVNVTVMDGAKLYAELLAAIERRLGREMDREYDFLPHVTLRYDGATGDIDPKDLRKFKWIADSISVQFGRGGKKHELPFKG